MPESKVLLDAVAVQRVLARMAHEIAERNDNSSQVVLVGIQRGGIYLAQRLADLLQGCLGPSGPRRPYRRLHAP